MKRGTARINDGSGWKDVMEDNIPTILDNLDTWNNGKQTALNSLIQGLPADMQLQLPSTSTPTSTSTSTKPNRSFPGLDEENIVMGLDALKADDGTNPYAAYPLIVRVPKNRPAEDDYYANEPVKVANTWTYQRAAKEVEEGEERSRARNLSMLMMKKQKKENRKEKNVVSVFKAEDIEGHRPYDVYEILQGLAEVNKENGEKKTQKIKKKKKKTVKGSKAANELENSLASLSISSTSSNNGSACNIASAGVETINVTSDVKSEKTNYKAKNDVTGYEAGKQNHVSNKSDIVGTDNSGSLKHSAADTTSNTNSRADEVYMSDSDIENKINSKEKIKVPSKKSKHKSVIGEGEALKNEILEKESQLEEQKASAGSVMSTKAKEMRKLIYGVEEAENRVIGRQKEIAEITARRSQLEKECDQEKTLINKLTMKRRKLEEFIATEISKSKEEMVKLREDIAALKAIQSKSDIAKSNALERVEKAEAKASLPPLDYINNKIKVKEKELECPVCFETSSVPIFMCQEFHLICSSCRPKVAECPECRLKYTGKPRRHR